MPYAGYRRGGYMYGGADEQNPFYNPAMPGPDYAAGISSLVQNLWQMDKLKKQEEAARAQQAFENQMAQADYQYKMAQAQALRERPTKPAIEPSEQSKTMAYLIETLGFTPEQAAMVVTGRSATPQELDMVPGMENTFPGLTKDTWSKMPKERKEKLTDEFLIRSRPKDETGEKELAAYDKDVASDARILKTAVSGYDSALAKLDTEIRMLEGQEEKSRSANEGAKYKDKTLRDKWAFYKKGLDEKLSVKNNLLAMKEHLAAIGEQLGAGQRLNAKQRSELMAAGSNIERAKSNPMFYRKELSVPEELQATADSIDTDPEFQAFVKAHPEEPIDRVRSKFKEYRNSQKR